MAEIGLVEAIATLREELAEAVEEGTNQDIQFPVGQIESRVPGRGNPRCPRRRKAEILGPELGADAGYAAQTVQKVTISLGAVTADNETVKIKRRLDRP